MQLIIGEVIALAIASEHFDAKHIIWRISLSSFLSQLSTHQPEFSNSLNRAAKR